MDGRSTRRVSDRISKKGNNVAWESSVRNRDQSFQCCNRRGCSGRIKTSPNVKTGNEVTGKSSNGSSVITGMKMTCVDSKRQLTPQPKGDSSESSLSVDLMSAPNSSSSGYKSNSKKKSVKAAVTEDGVSSGSLNVKRHEDFDHKLKLFFSLWDEGELLGSDFGNGVRNMPCNSTPAVEPSSSSSSDTRSAGKRVARKRSQEEEKCGISHRVEREKCLPSSSVVKGHHEDSSLRANSMKNKRSVGEAPVRKIPFRAGGLSSSSASSSNPSLTRSRSRDPSSAYSNRSRERPPHASSSSSPLNVPEQVRLMETSSIPHGGLNRHDPHREMRLDIDNMSYEELLALGERMGTVSTALSEEEMSKCIAKGIFQQDSSDVVEDAKCSICQEEYGVEDNTGTLIECKHGYHMSCITQWFRDKNWCPICKASAVGP